MVSPNELAAQASCYGLPYGIFGIFCWCFTFFSAALVHANCPILMPWRWVGLDNDTCSTWPAHTLEFQNNE
ncbi:unnamed protein product [Rhizophagus irregularis]|nr:unnamed protein product [Rhizophagus irregularis]CAB5377943.1 unnamed protein product [Rhizophagus irregularis]